ncbi:protocadherin alpha-2-like [Argopecten irradians]|uniref:protocadherin alpha-2-like n=1 Tax=Argopecten irradians TaxID=31199 RepID=UPI003717CD18
MVNLTLEVTDSGFLSNTAVVRLTISDTNDNRPTFGSTQYVHSMSDAVVGSTVLTVSASDLDSGLNGECLYLLNNSGSNPYRDVFAISESGSILLMQSIDSYASDHVFIFDVIVTDKGLPSLSSTSQVSLIIQQEVVNQPAAASAQVSEQEVDVASVLTSPGMLGMIAAIVTGFILVAIGNAICWLRSKSKVPGKESPTPELTRLEKSDADVPKKPMNKTKKDPDPIRKANKPTRSSSIDPQIEDYSCWNEVRGKSKLRVSTSDPGSTIPRVEVLTPLDTPSHLSVSRTASITQYVSHMSGKKSIDFF